MIFKNNTGYSLIELIVVVAIIVSILVGVTGSFRIFLKHSSISATENKKNILVQSALKLLQRDINMAGFGLPSETRLAFIDNYEIFKEHDVSLDFDCDTNASSNNIVNEVCVSYDIDNDGNITHTLSLHRDKLFIANGWTILKDVTGNNYIDGDIVESPIDYFYLISDKKDKFNGYKTSLVSDVVVNSGSIIVNNININLGDEFTISDDFKKDAALIIYGHGTNSTNHYSIEGHLIGSLNGNSINFQGTEVLLNSYSRNGSIVVPAISWYVKSQNGTFWLYRNEDKVLPNVLGFELFFGYDLKNDGLQWFSFFPPINNSIDSIQIDDTDSGTFISGLIALKAVRIVLVIYDKTLDTLQTYEKIIILKN